MQVQHVGGRIGELLGGQVGGAPVAGLLLLGQVDPEQFRQRSFRPWRSVKVRTSLAAILVQLTGATSMPSACCSMRDVEAGEMHQLDHRRIGQQAPQVRAVGAVAAQRGRARSAPGARRRRRPTAAPGKAGRDAGSAPSSRYRPRPPARGPAPSGRSWRCRWMVAFGVNWVMSAMRLGPRRRADGAAAPSAGGGEWCPGEDSNFHDLAATGT